MIFTNRLSVRLSYCAYELSPLCVRESASRDVPFVYCNITIGSFMDVCIEARWIDYVFRIITAVSEQIVVPGVETFRVFAGEAAQTRVIGASAVFIDPEG